MGKGERSRIWQSKKGRTSYQASGTGGLRVLFRMSPPPSPQPRAAWIHQASWHSYLGHLTGTKAFLTWPSMPHLPWAAPGLSQTRDRPPGAPASPSSQDGPPPILSRLCPVPPHTYCADCGRALLPELPRRWAKSPCKSVFLSQLRTPTKQHTLPDAFGKADPTSTSRAWKVMVWERGPGRWALQQAVLGVAGWGVGGL